MGSPDTATTKCSPRERESVGMEKSNGRWSQRERFGRRDEDYLHEQGQGQQKNIKVVTDNNPLPIGSGSGSSWGVATVDSVELFVLTSVAPAAVVGVAVEGLVVKVVLAAAAAALGGYTLALPSGYSVSPVELNCFPPTNDILHVKNYHETSWCG